MKGLFYTLLIAATLIVGYKLGIQNYKMKGVVTEVIQPCEEYPEGLVTFMDRTEHKWSFEGSEDWFEYDLLNAEMCDKGTDWVDDDEIVHVDYIGYVSPLLINKRPLKDLIY